MKLAKRKKRERIPQNAARKENLHRRARTGGRAAFGLRFFPRCSPLHCGDCFLCAGAGRRGSGRAVRAARTRARVRQSSMNNALVVIKEMKSQHGLSEKLKLIQFMFTPGSFGTSALCGQEHE
ncbi:hypothetical protein EVAR_57001_1 [Eumeta japonica]|uniref:Uncharacterized protein n=1 Tax=Eumeta variegata TaxID=151549 RepID=A0A4C1Z7G4_EUMVA|nr:hypothetical protein EVAR_57001_1 [Eumeta japonica]